VPQNAKFHNGCWEFGSLRHTLFWGECRPTVDSWGDEEGVFGIGVLPINVIELKKDQNDDTLIA